MTIYSNQPPEGPGQNRGAQNVQKPAAAEPRELATQVRRPASADRVDMSGWSKEAADIMSAVSQLPEVREARVRDIKQRIDAGIYTVDPLRIAERILKGA